MKFILLILLCLLIICQISKTTASRRWRSRHPRKDFDTTCSLEENDWIIKKAQMMVDTIDYLLKPIHYVMYLLINMIYVPVTWCLHNDKMYMVYLVEVFLVAYCMTIFGGFGDNLKSIFSFSKKINKE